MTEREKQAVHEWINNGFNGTAAYRKIFKKCKKDSTAAAAFSRMMKKDDVLEYRKQLLEDANSIDIASTNEILMYLTKVMRGQETDSFGLEPSLEERTKAAERLMKAKGMFVQKLEVSNAAEEEKQKSISNIESLVNQMVPIKEDDVIE